MDDRTTSGDDIEGAVLRYVPRRQDVQEALGQRGLQFVRRAALATGPGTRHLALVRVSYLANHVAWALSHGAPLEVDEVFSATVLRARALDLADRGWDGSSSTEMSVIESLARMLAPTAGHVRRNPLSGEPAAAPYGPVEQALLVAGARTIPVRDAASTLRGLALGAGAGATSARATQLAWNGLVRFDDRLLAAVGAGGQWVPVDPWWASQIAGVLESDGPVTTLFTARGKCRVQNAWRRATGSPEISSFRLHATHVVRLLDWGVPVDVIAASTGTSVSGLLTSYGHPGRTFDDRTVARWLSSPDPFRPAIGADLFRGLSPAATTAAVAAHRTVAERLARFVPGSPLAMSLWDGQLRSDFEALILEVAPNEERASDIASSVVALLIWMHDNDLPITMAVALQPSTLERWALSQSAKQLSANTAQNRRTNLRLLARTAGRLDRQERPSRDRAPRAYTGDDEQRMRLAADELGARARTVLDAAFVLGAGAGVEFKSRSLRPEQLRETDDGWSVEADGRWRPVSGRFADACARLHRSPFPVLVNAGYFNRLQRDLREVVPLSSVSLRHTWTHRHLLRGVPVDVLCQALGTSGVGLIGRVAEGLPTRPAHEVTAWLAGPSRPPTT